MGQAASPPEAPNERPPESLTEASKTEAEIVKDVEKSLDELKDIYAGKVGSREHPGTKINLLRQRITVAEQEKKVGQQKIAELREELARLTAKFEQGQRSANEPSPVSAEKQEEWWNPTTWSKETTQTATTVALAGAVSAGAIWILHKARQFFTKAKAKTVESVKKGYSWLKWALGGAVVFGLSYLGFQGWKKLTDVAKVTGEIKRLREEASTLTGKAKEAAEARIAQLENALKKPSVLTTPNNPISETPKVAVPKAVKETAETLKTMGIEEIIARTILAQGTNDWTLDERSKRTQLIGLISLNGAKTMSEISAARENATDQPLLFDKNTSDEKNREASVDTLLNFCDSHNPKVEDGLMQEKRCSREDAAKIIGTMTLKEYLELTLRHASAYMRYAHEFEKAGNIEEFAQSLKTMNFEYIFRGDQDTESAYRLILDEIDVKNIGVTEQELDAIEFSDLLTSALHSTNTNLRDECSKLEQKTDCTAAEKILLAIYKKILDPKNRTHEVMLPLFHGVFPSSEKDSGTTETVLRYLQDRMTASQALRFYLYHRMLDQGNAMALPLMQMEIIRFIAQHDNTFLKGTAKYQAIARMSGNLISQGGRDVLEQWKKLGFEFNIELTEDQQSILEGIGIKLASLPFVGFIENVKAGAGTFLAYPKAITGGILAAGMTKVAWARYGKSAILGTSLDDFKKMVGALPDMRGEKAVVTRAVGAARTMLSVFVPTFEEMSEAKTVFNMIHEVVTKSPTSPGVTKVAERLRACMSRPRQTARWTELATELRALGTHEGTVAAEQAEKMALPASRRVRAVFAAMRVRFSTSVTRSLFTLGLQPTISATAVAIDRVSAAVIEKTKASVTWIRNSKYFQEMVKRSGATAEALVQALSQSNMSPRFAEMLARSRGAMQMCGNAFRQGGSAALSYVAKLGNALPYAKMAAGPLSVIGLEGALIWIEFSIINGQIRETHTPEVKDVLEARKAIALGRAGVSTAVGLAAWSGGAAAMVPFLPIWVAYEAGSYGRKYFEEATIEWLKDDVDMQKDSLGLSIKKLDDNPPGVQNYNHQNAARGGNDEAGLDGVYSGSLLNQGMEKIGLAKDETESRFSAVEKANNEQRSKITKAYLTNMTMLPPKESETEAQYKERFAKFQTAQMLFIDRVTGKTYQRMSGEIYRRAHAHAELRELSSELSRTSSSKSIQLLKIDRDSLGRETYVPSGEEFDIAEYNNLPPGSAMQGRVLAAYLQYKQALALVATDLNPQLKEGEKARDRDINLQNELLLEVRYDLAVLDSKIIAADLDGWEWTGGEEKTRAHVRYAVNVEVRKALRAESDRLAALDGVDITDMERSARNIRVLLQGGFEKFDTLRKGGGYRVGYEEFARSGQDSSILMDWRHIAQDLYLHPAA